MKLYIINSESVSCAMNVTIRVSSTRYLYIHSVSLRFVASTSWEFPNLFLMGIFLTPDYRMKIHV